MSFLSELKNQRDKLKGTETVVTRLDGRKYVEGDNSVPVAHSAYGFVVDTKPDDNPVLVTDYMYIGSQDCAVERVLTEYNIRHVLSLGVDMKLGVNQKYIPMLDLPETELGQMLPECLQCIRDAVEARQNVLVHCNAGVSRTATIAIAYLMQYERMHFEEAYSLVKSKRPAIRPNDGFSKQLKAMKPGLLL